MIRTLAIVAIGGGLGSVARYLITLFINKLSTFSLPVSTFVANITGCLIIGIIYGLSDRYTGFTTDWKLFLITGICGGYTTFSTFSYENLQLLHTQQFGLFVAYTVGSLVVGLLAVWLGLSLVK